MLQADGNNLRLGRGEVYFDRFDANGASTGERFLGNVTSLVLSTEDELLEKYSSVESSSPLLKSVKIRRTVSIQMTMDEFLMENVALALLGSVNSASQASATAATATITDVQQDRTYAIGAGIYNVSSVVVKVAAATKVLNTDYRLDTTWGLIYVIPGGGIADDDDLSVTYDKAVISAYKKIFGGDSDIEGKLRYVSDNAAGYNDMLIVPKVAIQPEGETGFISDEFGSLGVTAKVLSVAGSELYEIHRLTGD